MANPDINNNQVNLAPTLRRNVGLNPALKAAVVSVTEANDPTKELGYFVKRSGLYMAGKGAAEAVGETMAHNAAQGNLLGLSTALGGTAAGLMTVGLAAGVSATLTQMDYIHRKDNIKDMYKDEIACRMQKPLKKVNLDDLDTLAKENRVVGEELKQIKKQRTFGVGLSFIASMAALSMVVLALPEIVAAVTGAATGAIAMEGLGTVGGLLLKGLVGLVTYNAVKEPLHHLADKLFNLDYTTTHDHIVKLKKGRDAGLVITPDQVLSVFASAHPELDHMIKREYGAKFDGLDAEKRMQATRELSKVIPLEKLANDINSGSVNVTELAFAVEGQISGIQYGRPAKEEKRGIITAIFKSIKSTLGFSRSEEHDANHDRISTLAKAETITETITENDPRHSNHAKQLGLKPRDPNMTRAETITQNRADQEIVSRQSAP